jgi:hypothetical protein
VSTKGRTTRDMIPSTYYPVDTTDGVLNTACLLSLCFKIEEEARSQFGERVLEACKYIRKATSPRQKRTYIIHEV